MKKISIISMIIIFINLFLKEIYLKFNNIYPLIIIPALVILIFSIYFYAQGIQRNISIICFSISAILMMYKFDYNILYTSLEKSTGMIAIFTVLPLLTFPIEQGNYSEAINNYITKIEKKRSGVFVILVIFHLILTIILNIPAMTIIQKIIEKNRFSKNYLTRLYTAGYSFYMVFSPYDGIVNMVLLMTAVKYYEYFLYALNMGIFIIIISIILLKITDKTIPEISENLKEKKIKPVSKNDLKKIKQLLINILILILITIYSSYAFKSFNSMFIISFIILIYSLVWSFQTCTFKEYKSQFKSYINKATKFGSILVFLISTNCLGEILKYTSLSRYMEKGFLKIIFLPEYFIIEVLIIITVLLSLAGIHMIIPVTSMAMIIKPEFLKISPPAFALLLLICWISGMSISPFVPFSAMVAETIDEKITTVTFKYNRYFVVVVMITAPIIILFLNNILS